MIIMPPDGGEKGGSMTAVIFLVLGILCCLYCIGIFLSGVFGSWFFLIWGVLGIGCFGISGIFAFGLWERLPVGIRGTAAILFSAGLLFFLLIEGRIVSRFYAKAEPGLDCLVVLGAQMRENGPSKALQLRLDTAYDYLVENPDTIVIVSGGKGSNEPVSEAQGMYEYLAGRGIDPERIRREDRSRNTVENLRFSRAFIEEGASVGIVTNNFHVYRAERLAAGQGYGRVQGIAAPCDVTFQANNMLREFFGIMKDRLAGNMKL